jgi:hypothetical protein
MLKASGPQPLIMHITQLIGVLEVWFAGNAMFIKLALTLWKQLNG